MRARYGGVATGGTPMGDVTVYQCSDGNYYTGEQLWARLESETWQPCCWDPDDGREWVRTADDDLLALVPVSTGALPAGVSIERDGRRWIVADEREFDGRQEPVDSPARPTGSR